MRLKIYQIDAFTNKVFSGNPAAICPLGEWIDNDLMQKIAMENNLAETAFYVKRGDVYEIRWFTPKAEVDLCGHATLAAAFVLFNMENHQGDTIHFHSPRSGKLVVTKMDDLLTLNFPTDTFELIDLTEDITTAFDFKPQLAYKGKSDYMLIFEREEDIKNMKPHLTTIAQLGGRGVIVSARGNDVDFVSRFFAPQVGIDEDPITGSAHTTLTPYWASILGKNELTAIQLSKRKGYLQCRYFNERVEISGECRLYLIGEVFV